MDYNIRYLPDVNTLQVSQGHMIHSLLSQKENKASMFVCFPCDTMSKESGSIGDDGLSGTSLPSRVPGSPFTYTL
jgi:hypothetical protein